jgi:hypothetical protein
MARSGDVGHDPVLDQTLQHFELILIKPREAAETAAVDLDQVRLAVKPPGHRIAARWTGQQRDRGSAAVT